MKPMNRSPRTQIVSTGAPSASHVMPSAKPHAPGSTGTVSPVPGRPNSWVRWSTIGATGASY
jgi:hypothetical protein